MAYLESGSGALLSSAQAITTSAASTYVFDVTGAGVGVAPTMIGFVNNSGVQGVNTDLGADIGVGQSNAQPGVFFVVTTAGTGTGTITCAIQAAPDNGSYSEGSYTTLSSSQAFVGTALTLGLNFWLPVPPVPSNYGRPAPRFYRAYYTQTGDGAVSMTADLMMNPPDAASVLIKGSNYISAY